MRILLSLVPAALLLSGVVSTANAQVLGIPLSCSASVPVVPVYSSGAGPVLVGDFFLECIGGDSVFPGPIPQYDLMLTLSVPILGTTQPILLVDRPGSPRFPNPWLRGAR